MQLLGGDWNETYSDERKSSRSISPPTFLPLLSGPGGLVDLSRDIFRDSESTFFYRRGGIFGGSKLDHFFCSSQFASRAKGYFVDVGSPLQSPHRPVCVEFSFSLDTCRNTDRFVIPNGLRFRRCLRVPEGSENLQFRLCSVLDDIFSRGLEELPTTSESPEILQSLFHDFSKTIYKVSRRILGARKRRRFVNTYSGKTDLNIARDLRSMSFFLKEFLTDKGGVFSEEEFLSKHRSKRAYTCLKTTKACGLFPPVSPLYSDWVVFLDQVSSFAIDLTRRLESVDGDGREDRRDDLFARSRTHFYRRYVRGGSSRGYPDCVYDRRADAVVREPREVLRVFYEEASAILSDPVPEPPHPEWYEEMYSYNAVGVDTGIWKGLVEPITEREVRSCFEESESRSPGVDGISNELLMIILTTQTGGSGGINHTLRYMTRLLNLWFFSGHSCRYVSKGMIVLIPKPGKYHSTRYAYKRPLTMSNEIPKDCLSVLATRFRNILSDHCVLHPANRAYLRGGSIDECHRTLIDLLEESHSENKSLTGIFYDVRKAFDRIQWWHVRDTCRRMALPVVFTNFLMSYLQTSTAYVRTAYGFTEPISLLNSVKQGDPLSGYIYVCCMDGLHVRLSGLAASCGVSVSRGVSLASLGYADDTLVLSRTFEGLGRLHGCVDEFFIAHTLGLNGEKTEGFCIGFSEQEVESVGLEVEGRLVRFNQSESLRYLGLHYTVDLDWTLHVRHIERTSILPLWRRLVSGDFSLTQAVSIYNDLVVSVIGFCSKFFSIPDKYLKRWDSLFYRAFVKILNPLFRNITRQGFYAILGILSIEDTSLISSASELMITLNTKSSVAENFRTRCARHILPFGEFQHLPRPRGSLDTGINGLLRRLRDHDILVHLNYDSQWMCTSKACMFGVSLPSSWTSPPSGVVDVFTDGSTDPAEPSRPSGFTAVIVSYRDLWTLEVVLCVIHAEGNNYVAECAALVSALEVLPSACNIRFFTDSLSFIDSNLVFRHKTARQRLRISCRNLIQRFEYLCLRRRGGVQIQHVRSHTLHPDFWSRGNEMADRACNLARCEISHTPYFPQVGEGIYTLGIGDILVTNDYRRTLTDNFRERQFRRWAENQFQGHLAAFYGEALLSGLRSSSKYRSSFGIHMLTRSLLMGRLLHHIPRFRGMKMCPFCDMHVVDVEQHFFTCSANISILHNIPRHFFIDQHQLKKLHDFLFWVHATLKKRILNRELLNFSREMETALPWLHILQCVARATILDFDNFVTLLSKLDVKDSGHQCIDRVRVAQPARCFSCTSLVTGGFPFLDLGFRRWIPLSGRIPSLLGGWQSLSGLVDTSTVLDVIVDSVLFQRLVPVLSLAEQSPYPTRIIFYAYSKDFTHENLQQITGPDNTVLTYIYQNKIAVGWYTTDRDLFSQIFASHPTYTCEGGISLPSPREYIFGRLSLIPFPWIPEFNLLHSFDHLLPPPLRRSFDHATYRSPLLSRVLGIVTPSERYEFSQECTDSVDRLERLRWVGIFSRAVFELRNTFWNKINDN